MALYVYGVMRASDVPKGSASVCEGDLAALVEEIEDGQVKAERAALSRHLETLRGLLGDGPVVPMSFGTVMPGEETLRRDLLEARGEELTRLLEHLEDKVEFEVTATYDEEAMLRCALERDPQLASERDRLRGLPEDATHFARAALGEKVVAAVDAMRAQDAAAILSDLEPLAVSVRPGRALHERIVLTAAFLLEGARVEDFDSAMERASRERADRMSFKLVGPLPAFSFVDGEPAWA